MKTIIFVTLVFFSTFASANTLDALLQKDDVQKAQLLEALNQLDGEVLEALLSEDAYDWYVAQFQRPTDSEQYDTDHLLVPQKPVHGPVDIGNDGYNDPNAPTFD